MLNWGLIGGGGIAYVFCNAMRFTNTGQAGRYLWHGRDHNAPKSLALLNALPPCETPIAPRYNLPVIQDHDTIPSGRGII